MSASERAVELLFYDGTCALCHATVRFVLKRDAKREAFLFAPIGGELYQRVVAAATTDELPDSFIVRTSDGRLLLRSAAMLHVLTRLGFPWPSLAGLLARIPTRFRDRIYDAVARVRYGLFGRKTESCPRVPPELRSRFAR